MFCCSGRLDQFVKHAELPSLLENSSEFHAPRLETWRKGTQSSAGGNRKMHARPEVREILIAGKLKRWALIGQHPHAYPNCSPARGAAEFFETVFPLSADRAAPRYDPGLGVPSYLTRDEPPKPWNITTAATNATDRAPFTSARRQPGYRVDLPLSPRQMECRPIPFPRGRPFVPNGRTLMGAKIA